MNDVTYPTIDQIESCVRVKLTVSLACETYIPVNSNPESVKREEVICKIIYSSTSKYTNNMFFDKFIDHTFTAN